MAVGLGDGLSVTLCGGESAVDPSIRSGHEESAKIELEVVGMGTTIGRWTVAGWMFVSMSSISLCIKLHLNSQTHTYIIISIINHHTNNWTRAKKT